MYTQNRTVWGYLEGVDQGVDVARVEQVVHTEQDRVGIGLPCWYEIATDVSMSSLGRCTLLSAVRFGLHTAHRQGIKRALSVG